VYTSQRRNRLASLRLRHVPSRPLVLINPIDAISRASSAWRPVPVLPNTLQVRWRVDYNAVRPHSSLGYQTPEEFAAAWHAANAGGCGAPAASVCRRARAGQGQAFGALRASLTGPARDGLEDKRSGRKDGSAGAEQKDCVPTSWWSGPSAFPRMARLRRQNASTTCSSPITGRGQPTALPDRSIGEHLPIRIQIGCHKSSLTRITYPGEATRLGAICRCVHQGLPAPANVAVICTFPLPCLRCTTTDHRPGEGAAMSQNANWPGPVSAPAGLASPDCAPR
jgi:integrase-like protein